MFQSTRLSAPHKDLDLWTPWASVRDPRAAEAPDPIYLLVVSVGVMVWLMWDCTLYVCSCEFI